MPRMPNAFSAVLSAIGFRRPRQDTPPPARVGHTCLPPPGMLPVASPGELLANRRASVSRIEELAGTTQAHFERYYLDTLHRFARWCQQRPAFQPRHAHPGGLLDFGMGAAAAALKIRQGHLLPPGAMPEEAVLKKDLWTFAVFTLALLGGMAKPTLGQTVTLSDGTASWVWNPWSDAMNDDPTVRWHRVAFSKESDVDISESASLLLANLIVAPAGLAWLSSDATVFPAWLACATGDKASAGMLGHILDKARSLPSSALSAEPKAAVPTMQTEPSTPPELPELENQSILPMGEKASDTLPELPAIDGLPNGQTHPANEIQPAEFTGTVGRVRQEARDGGQEVPAAKFMEWLRTGIGQGRIPYNEKDARVHVAPEGVLLVTPNIFKDFTGECGGGRWDTVQKLFIKRKGHVRTASGENIHQYTLGAGPSQTVLSGFLLKDSALVFGLAVPELNQQIRKQIDGGGLSNGMRGDI
ncbi:MAG: helicase/relaxase domain-containing protein [Proteobacteria bacterium]|nr:helicase/relaxase domain-containing protein [Pseudomonadota bacterium]